MNDSTEKDVYFMRGAGSLGKKGYGALPPNRVQRRRFQPVP